MFNFSRSGYKSLPAANRALVRLEWRQEYAEAVCEMRKQKADYKWTSRAGIGGNAIQAGLRKARIQIYELLDARKQMKWVAAELHVSTAARVSEKSHESQLPQLPDAEVLALCAEFDIATYQVGKVFGDILPKADAEKWFVALSAEYSVDAKVIPLCLSEMDAQRAAVHHLKLDRLATIKIALARNPLPFELS